MIIDYFIFAILTFISPFIISRYFELNNYKGYTAGLYCSLSILGSLLGLTFALFIIFVYFQQLLKLPQS